MMKKFLYSLVIIGGFSFYAIFQNRFFPQPSLTADVASNSNTQAPVNAATSSLNLIPVQVPVASDPPRGTSTTVATPTPVKTTPAPAPVPVKTTPTPVPTPAPVVPAKPKGQYTDGQYTGSVADAYYGNIQVEVTISGGKITDVVFLQYPNDRSNSRYINSQAMPYLKQEAIQAQSANVSIVSGATDTSQAFQQSLSSALSQAKA